MPSSRLILALKPTAAATLMSIPAMAYAGPADTAITAVKTSKAARIGDFKGRVVALHSLTRTTAPEYDAFVKEVLKNAPSLAGVTHIFIKADLRLKGVRSHHHLPAGAPLCQICAILRTLSG